MKIQRHNLYVAVEILSLCFALVSGCALGWFMFGPEQNFIMISASGLFFTLFLLITIAIMLDPDRVRARQSMSVLNLASATLEAMQTGFTTTNAQKVCEILYPNTAASAVAITNNEVVLGYYGEGSDQLGRPNSKVRTEATRQTIQDGETRVLTTAEEVGLPSPIRHIRAAVIVPLKVGNVIQGTLKFYYSSSARITETQISIAEGFGQLLSTQIAAMELEEQRKLATSMELKALQSQINPHFLFNTINTMASFVRTDPERARVMLREFAVFYRQTLENSSDLISFSRELEQTLRYLSLEQARFGEDRLSVRTDVSDDVCALLVPAFMLQPLVENAVKHGMPAEGKLTITITGKMTDGDVYIYVSDDGIGMDKEALDHLTTPSSEGTSNRGLGIAVKNIRDRIKGYFGPGSYMHIDSKRGQGTRVTLYLKQTCAPDDIERRSS